MKKPVLIIRHMPHEPGGTLETALAAAGLTFQYIDLFCETPDRLPLDRASGLIVLGGQMNVDEVEKYPFLAADVRWIGQAISMEMPMLGVCLGAQLLAKTLGAKVYPSEKKEIGWHWIELLPAAGHDQMFLQTGRRMVFQWHGDTFDLPRSAACLARGLTCRNQAFRYGRNAYGLQFHIEMTAAMIDDWLAEPVNRSELAELNYVDPQEIQATTPVELPRLQELARDVLGRFAKMCVDYSA